MQPGMNESAMSSNLMQTTVINLSKDRLAASKGMPQDGDSSTQ